jgi:N-acetylmuramoyl-L-alanine amidase
MASRSARQTNTPVDQARLFLLGQPLAVIIFLALGVFGVLSAWFFFNRTVDQPIQAYTVIAPEENGGNLFGVGGSEMRQRWVNPDGEPLHIGLIAGHKESDAGAICENGLTEADINANIANLVAARLEEDGLKVDILNEFDERLQLYSADALISIHADSCGDYGDTLTGFKLAAAETRPALALKNCMYQAYATTTQLYYHVNTITPHMTDYHAFRKIAPDTPAIIIETGFMNRDMDILTKDADVVSAGIEAGILCFLEQSQ